MSRAQDGSPDTPQGPQTGQGASSTGTTAGAAATGATGDTMTSTGRGMHAREPTSDYARGAGAPAEYGRGAAPSGYEADTADGAAGGTFLILAGLVTFFAGLTAVVRVHYFHTVTSVYPYAWSVKGWGWAILILGAVMFAVGACALLGMSWAKPVGVFVAVLAVIGAFMWLVYSPFWGIILLALSTLAIWGLLRTQRV